MSFAVSEVEYLRSKRIIPRSEAANAGALSDTSSAPPPPAFQGCTAADDKTASVEDFLRYLYGAMAHDAIWQYASEEQLQDAQMAIERSVMNRIFKLAFYPNQDGDILRDQYAPPPAPAPALQPRSMLPHRGRERGPGDARGDSRVRI